MGKSLQEAQDRDSGKTSVFCPLMKEWCTKGWTPKMGREPDQHGSEALGLPRYGSCAAWRPISLKAQNDPAVYTLHGCAEFEHTGTIQFEIAQEVSRAVASIDKVANEVADSHATFVVALGADAQKRILESGIPLKGGPRGLAKLNVAALENHGR